MIGQRVFDIPDTYFRWVFVDIGDIATRCVDAAVKASLIIIGRQKHEARLSGVGVRHHAAPRRILAQNFA